MNEQTLLYLLIQSIKNSYILRELNKGRGTQGSYTDFLTIEKKTPGSLYHYRRMTPQQKKERTQ